MNAGIPKPKVGISETNIPNAFAFGRTKKDGRVCVTRGILNLLDEEELKAVLGHEISHIRHRDMAVMTLISVVPSSVTGCSSVPSSVGIEIVMPDSLVSLPW